jgi:hypothetical protein
MPEIGDVMDVTIDDLTPEQQAQLKDVVDQFQMKCLMSFGKNRSGVPYLKSEMPRVLLPGEPDTTSFQEKEEALQAFRDIAEAVLGRHHTAFLGMFKQMKIACSAQAWKRCLVEYALIHHQQRSEKPVLLSQRELNRCCRASRSSLLHKALGVSQSNLLYKALGVNRSNLLYRALGVSRSNPLYKAWGVSRSGRLCKTIEVNLFNSRTHISLHMGNWHSVCLECRPIPLTR